MMFRGVSNLSVDAKGRIAIPVRYRDAFISGSTGQAMITVDYADQCLLVYTMDQWLGIEQKLMALPNMNPRIRNMTRLILGYASEVELDNQGRILITPPLIEYAELSKKIVLVGLANKFELWDAERWHAARKQWVVEAQTTLVNSGDVLGQVSI